MSADQNQAAGAIERGADQEGCPFALRHAVLLSPHQPATLPAQNPTALTKAADVVVIANATGNPDLYREAVADLVKEARTFGSSVGEPAGWRGFIEQCATCSGGMVNGNRLSMQAQALLDAGGRPDGQRTQTDPDMYLREWAFVGKRQTSADHERISNATPATDGECELCSGTGTWFGKVCVCKQAGPK